MDTIICTHAGNHIAPKTQGQADYVATMQKNIVTFAVGCAGTGKTFLAIALASAYLRGKLIRKIILTRPAVEAGERLGFLPGDLHDKVDPYIRPLVDALKDIWSVDVYNKLFAKGVIEIAPLAFMRGRTLNDSFIILDEAQNSTPAQMKMFLTRLGFNSRMVITGDLSQCDLPTTSGLHDAVNRLQNIPRIGFSFLSTADVVRHDLVAKIISAYERSF